jgi:hypothetical protein
MSDNKIDTLITEIEESLEKERSKSEMLYDFICDRNLLTELNEYLSKRK